MTGFSRVTLAALALASLSACQNSARVSLDDGPALHGDSWGVDQSQPILSKTLPVRLDPDLSGLPGNERAAVEKLLAAGRILQNLYEDERHRQAATSRRYLAEHSESADSAARNLGELYDLFAGPIATTLDNQRPPFLPVDSLVPGKNFYPWGIR